MAASVRVMIGRALNSSSTSFNVTTAASPINDQTSATNQTALTTATERLISSLVFAESKSVRTSTIILASFNVLAAFVTAASILYDCYWASKRCNPKFKTSKFCMSWIHPAETFPLIVSTGIVIQGIVFAGVQGRGLQSLFTSGCGEIAQFMWPALFIVPYIQLVFGLECALRSLRKIPFQARGKHDVTICCGVILLMLIVTWIPSNIFPEPDECFASLLWFITRFGKGGFIILSIATGTMILSALTIFYRLSTVNMIDQHQRIAASRMVYYLVVGVVSLAFVLPFFFSLTKKYRDSDLKLAMMATVVLNLSGLMNGLLQLFLRSNTASSLFGPKSGSSWDRDKHEIRIFGPNELAMQIQMANPVTGPRGMHGSSEISQSRSSSRVSLIGPNKGSTFSEESVQNIISPTRYKVTGTMPAITESSTTPKITSPLRGHAQKPSYSLFPIELNIPKSPQQSTSIYNLGDLEPPPPIHPTRGIRHRRDSSVVSSATVQIGLRISHAPTRSAPSSEDLESSLPLPSATYNSKKPMISPIISPLTPPTSSAELPPPSPSTLPSPLPLQPRTYNAKHTSDSRPDFSSSPLKVNTTLNSPAIPPRSPRRPSPFLVDPLANSESPTRAAINKTLPPTPIASLQLRESNTQLSPAVYTPEKKNITMGGNSITPFSAMSPKKNPLGSNPLPRSNSGAELALSSGKRSPAQATTKADWI